MSILAARIETHFTNVMGSGLIALTQRHIRDQDEAISDTHCQIVTHLVIYHPYLSSPSHLDITKPKLGTQL